MGLFKDFRQMKKTADELSKDQKRPGLREGMRQATAAMKDAQEQQQTVAHLQANGQPAVATINSMEATGTQINNMPELEMQLSVDVNGFKTEVTHRQVISPAMLGSLQPGAQVNVLVDPGDTSKLVIAG